MKQKMLCLLLCLLLLSTLPLTVLADEIPPLVVDNAGLMMQAEVEILRENALEMRRTYHMDIIILTVDNLGGKRPQDYADDFYDEDYGYGNNYSGILFLLSMEERDWYISTYGDGIYALTDYGIQATAAKALPYLSRGDYFGGFAAWQNALVPYLDAFQAGTPIDGYADDSGDYYHGDQEETIYYEEDTSPSILLSLIIGLAAGGITIAVMRMGMNTKRPQHSAADYLKPGSYHLRTHQDLFLYSNVTKTARPKNTGSSGGGGSSVHRSSSGRRHGGGGGKF